MNRVRRIKFNNQLCLARKEVFVTWEHIFCSAIAHQLNEIESNGEF